MTDEQKYVFPVQGAVSRRRRRGKREGKENTMEKTACPSSYVVVDLETTGLYPSQDRILEIGAVKVLDGEVADTFCMFADPQMKIPEKIRELTGITQEMVAGQPTPAEAVRAFLDFCGELDLMGHNLIFDYSFLKHQAADQKIPFEKKWN